MSALVNLSRELSVYSRKRSLHCKTRLLHRSLPKSSTKISVFLLYKQHKIQIDVDYGTDYTVVKQKLYQKIFAFCSGRSDVQKAKKATEEVLGFSSVSEDILFDYMFSIGKGKVEAMLFLRPFFAKEEQNQRYAVYRCLAIGGFSKVYLVRSYADGRFYAAKFIRKQTEPEKAESQLKSLQNEVDISSKLDHPFLLHLHHAFQTESFYGLVFQYLSGGELFFLLRHVKKMSQNEARFYFLQILLGIQHLHNQEVIYRDMKPENIILDFDGHVRIADFGLSKLVAKRQKTYSYCGSAQYMAPQMILGSGHNSTIDYYSLGALLYELVTGMPPFYCRNPQIVEQRIVSQQIQFPVRIDLSDDLKDLLRKLLIKDEKMRLGAYLGVKQIIAHPWVGKINARTILNRQLPCPFAPSQDSFNFDLSDLGSDEAQFTNFVKLEVKKSQLLTVYMSRVQRANSEFINNLVIQPISELSQTVRQKKSDLPQPRLFKNTTVAFEPSKEMKKKLMPYFQDTRSIGIKKKPLKPIDINRSHRATVLSPIQFNTPSV